ncbi:MAG: beta-lactamase family protein [Exiguobacterium chiriqhucha]|uniref:serine hydrolase domain-containing protein n=1 Tax=Exiguobacterium chiriqhucha TaxID=1385984 RepID=UPI001450EBF9|nr:serine hydrolase domain-containing protein [Exiguobacterium chiriqhucha]KAB2863774.1 MAG: beta-lactamase family protein [Exiguobacterium chiriqhucha]
MPLDVAYIEERMKYHRVPGCSIAWIEHGRLMDYKQFGTVATGSGQRVKADTRFNACSMSKFLTSVLVMKLVETGQVALDVPVNDWLDSWQLKDGVLSTPSEVTLRQLLRHESGIIDATGSFGELDLTFGRPSMIALLNGDTPYHDGPVHVTGKPGQTFHYSDAGFCVIQLLIEDVMERPFANVIRDELFVPLRMHASGYHFEVESVKFASGHDKHGHSIAPIIPHYPYPAAAGLWTTTEDLSRVVIEMMEAVKGNSRVLSPRMVKDMLSGSSLNPFVGLGVFLDGEQKRRELSSLGWGIGFQSMIVAYPYIGKAIIIMTNAELGVHQMDGLIGDIYRATFN